MSFMTIVEKKSLEKGRKEGLQQGLQQGIKQGRQQAIIVALEVKFSKLNNEIIDLIKRVESLDDLDYLLEQAKLAKTLEAFFTELKKKVK
ncbi:hypothetical protein DRI50_03915 [candidate division KSB1 bacterium]|nr:MAG: hypothetical protein DRI50_03915 [candidate division KSB1 bacterium]